jgi:hypothetical protein
MRHPRVMFRGAREQLVRGLQQIVEHGCSPVASPRVMSTKWKHA